MSFVSSPRRLTFVVAAAIATLAATVAPAMAAGDAVSCPAAATSKPFAPWGDLADYQLATGGSAESATGWALAGASVVEGNETFMVTSPTDHRSMRLPTGASATSARMCVGLEHPTFRFFVKRSSGASTTSLAVDVVYTASTGREMSLRAGVVSGSGAWAPSPVLPTMVELIGATASSTVRISFRFKPQGTSVWSIDDLYVDPHKL